MLARPVAPALLLLLGLPLMAGCAGILGQRFVDFQAYYNTFYNAQRDLARAERAIIRADPVVDRSRFLPLFHATVQAARGDNPPLDQAIRRAADVLRNHPTSRWVDDALLLIGKAYFYQGHFDAAAQKFGEVLQLDETPLADEAHLWLGRALTQARAYGPAAAALRDGLAREGLRPHQWPLLRLALAELELRRGDYAAAADGLREGLERLDDPELGARAAFLLGQVREYLGDYAGATSAYDRALRLRPSPELIYAAEIQRTLAMARSGRADEALARLERLRRDDRYIDHRAEVEKVRGRVLAMAGRPAEAAELLRGLLYRPEAHLRVDRVRGHIHYRLGEIYRQHLDDFARAAAHFDTAATALRQRGGALADAQTTREAPLDADFLARSYGSYSRIRARIAEMDSLLYLASLDDASFEAAIEAIAAARHQAAMAAERERRRRQELEGFGGQVTARAHEPSPVGGGAAEVGGAGFLNHRNPARVQENLLAFHARWGERPRVPNWRRRAAISAAAMAGGQAVPETAVAAALNGRTALVDVSAVPRDPERRAQMELERARARYELGNVLFLTLNDPDRAEPWYRLVIEEDAGAPVAVRALFALAEVYLARGDRARAETIFRQLSELPPDDPLSVVARERLGLEAPPRQPDAEAAAEQHYVQAFAAWEQGEHARALRQMLDIDRAFPGSETAARSRLAAGLIYSQWAAADTSLLIAATPDALLEADRPDQPRAAVTARPQPSTAPPSARTPKPDPPDDAAPEPPQADAPEAADDTTTIEAPIIFPAELLAHAAEPDPGARDTASVRVHPDDAPLTPNEPALPRPWLEALYESVEIDFPGTPFAERARLLRGAIAEMRSALEERLRKQAEAQAAQAHEQTDAPVADDGSETGEEETTPEAPGEDETSAVPQHNAPADERAETAHARDDTQRTPLSAAEKKT